MPMTVLTMNLIEQRGRSDYLVSAYFHRDAII
jgi:hypothetical protein